jgi:hypothetical protein
MVDIKEGSMYIWTSVIYIYLHFLIFEFYRVYEVGMHATISKIQYVYWTSSCSVYFIICLSQGFSKNLANNRILKRRAVNARKKKLKLDSDLWFFNPNFPWLQLVSRRVNAQARAVPASSCKRKQKHAVLTHQLIWLVSFNSTFGRRLQFVPCKS